MKNLIAPILCLFSLSSMAQTNLEILKFGDPNLRVQAITYDVLNELNNPNFQNLITDMLFTMKKNHLPGLASTQVNSTIRMFVMKDKHWGPGAFINPHIVEEEGSITSYESCPSLPGKMIKIQRARKIRLDYRDGRGVSISDIIDGRFAITVQHELDHLNGVLIIDHHL